MELLARYLERGRRRVVTLVRARDDLAARERVDVVLTNLFGADAGQYADRVEAVAGELTAPRLGLSAARCSELAEQVTTIVHSAASVSFALPLAGGARDQRRGDPADARVRRGGPPEPHRARALRPHLDRIRRRHARRPLLRERPRRRAGVPQLLRAVEVRSRATGAVAPGAAVHDPASEHRRRRSPQRLDLRVQRSVLAAARVRARSVHRRAGDSIGAGRRRLGRLCRRRDLRAVRRRGRSPARPTT